MLVLSRRLRNSHIDPVLEAVPGASTTFHHRLINNTLVASVLQDQKYLQGYTVINVAKLFKRVICSLLFSSQAKLSYNLVSIVPK